MMNLRYWEFLKFIPAKKKKRGGGRVGIEKKQGRERRDVVISMRW